MSDMQSTPAERPEIDPAALSDLATQLQNPDFRSAFKADPTGAVQQFGVPHLPQAFLEHLAALTAEELAFLAREIAYIRSFPLRRPTAEWL